MAGHLRFLVKPFIPFTKIHIRRMASMQQMTRIHSSRPVVAPRLAPSRLANSSRMPTAVAAAAPAKAGIIDGKKIAEDIRKEIAAEVQQLQSKAGRAPGLAGGHCQ